MDRFTFLKQMGFGLLGMHQLRDLSALAGALETTDPLPALFLGHGSPMNAIEENQFVAGFRNIARQLPEPKTILCISAHWFTKGTKLTAMAMPRTIHDFGGFPPELFAVQYPAPGNPEMAKSTQQLLRPYEALLDEHWGLDHGAWSVLRHLYPKANIPVVQLSLDYTQGPEYHFNLAKQLSSLRHKGVLMVGSGNIIHNLSLIDFKNMDKDNYGYDWAIEAHDSINAYLLDGNYRPLIDYHKQSKAFQLAIPTPDHYLPLLYILALQGKGEQIELFNDKLLAGSLSMTALKISKA